MKRKERKLVRKCNRRETKADNSNDKDKKERKKNGCKNEKQIIILSVRRNTKKNIHLKRRPGRIKKI